MKKILLVLSFLLSFGLALPQVKIDIRNLRAKPKTDDICLNEQCIEASHRLFQLMNKNVDPCEDFSEFVCGRFYKEKIIPEDKKRYGSFTTLSDKLEQRARTLLEEPIDTKTDFESHIKAKKLYRECMNEEKRNELGNKPLKDILNKELFGGWPVLEGQKWSSSDFNVWDQVLKIYKAGYSDSYIFTTTIRKDAKDTSKRVLALDQTSFGLSKEYLDKGLDEPEVQAYFKYMVDTAKFLGATESAAKEELLEVLQFEHKLANISARREDRRNKTLLYNPTILGDIKSEPGLPKSWIDYIQALLDLPNVKIDVDRNTPIIIRDPYFYGNLSQVMENTSNRVLANYLGWRVAASSMRHLDSEARAIRHEFRKSVYGTKVESSLWKQCISLVGFNSYSQSNFVYAASSMYAQRYFTPEDKEQLFEMTQYLRKAFSGMLDDLDWMDESTREEAQKKLESMEQYLAYPDEVLDSNEVDKIYQGLEIETEDYFGSMFEMSKHFSAYHTKKLNEPVNPRDWREHHLVAVVNAFYNPDFNNFEFPAGILQGHFFNPNVPKYLNYGAIGGVIGHEITHGFDDQGRQRNSEGTLQDWWDTDTNKGFKDRAQCIIWQYGNYTSKQVGINLNGINTQGENIADNGGIKEAYLGYKNWVQDNDIVEPKLPGHEYTPEQLFWISWGQVWCSKYRDLGLKNQILTGAHSPGMFRINGPLSNNKDFANDFNCSLGSKMNPEKKCEVW